MITSVIYSLHLSVIKFVVFGTFFTFLHAMKRGKTRNGLIQEQAMKGNRFNTRLASETTSLFSKKNSSL